MAAKVGLVGIGLEAYWEQFPGLEDRLKQYVGRVSTKLRDMDIDVVEMGLVDSMAKSLTTGHALRRADLDLLVIYATTYALSSTVLPMVQRAKCPVLVLSLQPGGAIDYKRFNQLGDRREMTAEWLAWCGVCPVSEIANVLRRAGIPVHAIHGMLDDDPICWDEIHNWMRATNAMVRLAASRIGLMGHYYSGMLDIATDLTAVSATFGCMFEMIEVDQLSALRVAVADEDAETRITEFQANFEIEASCPHGELLRAARTSVALDRLVADEALDALAYFYKGSGNSTNEDTMSSIILGTSMLTSRGVPVAGEYEVKNVLAMKIMDLLQAGGSFTEFYAVDFPADIVLLGHDGPGHTGIAEGKTLVRPLEVYHGKVGQGLSVEMSVRTGPVTLLSIVEDTGNGRYFLLIAEGEVEAGATLQIGNTNSRFRFSIGARGFLETWNAHGPAHHCAVGVGHCAGVLQKLAALLGIRAVQVC